MNKFFNFFILMIFFFTSNCSGLKKGLGIEKNKPNEFLIRKIDRLEKPPNYDLLPPNSKSIVKSSKIKNKTNQTKNLLDSTLKKQKNLEKNIINKNKTAPSVDEEILKELSK